MVRFRIRREFLLSALCVMCPAPFLSAQTSQPDDASLSASTSSTKAQLDVVHKQQLADCRAGILDPEGRPAERRRWARTLFSYDSPLAKAMVIELLSLNHQPKAQAALCSVIQQRVSQSTALSDMVLVDPLLDLLNAPSDEARQAAATALAAYRQNEVIENLGLLCTDDSASTAKRIAAIDALAPNIDRVDVVRQLISILKVESLPVLAQALSALAPATLEPLGTDVQAWQAWWESKSKLSEKSWLEDRLHLYLRRFAAVENEYQSYRTTAEQHLAIVTTKLGVYQREVYAISNPEQRDAKLIDWLQDSATEIKLVAMGIIKGHIADDGRRPTDDVLSNLLTLLRDESTAVRREVLIIVQTLVDPEIEQALLARIDEEHDAVTRETLFRAVGRLNSAKAIHFLVREIESPDSLTPCVREAAIALAQTATKLDDKQRSAAVAALKPRYALTPESDIELRAALLSAMAGVAENSFLTEFQISVDTAESLLIRPAIRGLVALGDHSRNARLRSLCADANALVRRDAVEALGVLGQEEADLEGVLSRLNPKIESNNLVYEAAWKAFLRLLSDKAAQQQFTAAQGLREFSDLEIRYLTKLSDSISQDQSSYDVLEQVNLRLIDVLVIQDKCAEAIPYRQRIYDLRIKSAQTNPDLAHDDALIEAGRQWLLAALDCQAANADVGSVLSYLLVTSKDASGRIAMIKTMGIWMDQHDWADQLDRLSTLSESFRSITPQPTGDDWTQLLQRMSQHVENGPKNSTSPTP